MQNYKEVCEGKKSVWFEVHPSEGEKFLKWAKSLGCVWADGSEIEPKKGANFFHFSIRNDGTLAYVCILVWVNSIKHPSFKNIERYVFSEYIKGKKVKATTSYMTLS